MVTEQETRFVFEYLKLRNISQAYMKAFGCDKDTARKEGRKLYKRKDIQEKIVSERTQLAVNYDVDVKDYVEFLVNGAFADIGNYVRFGQEEIPEYQPDGTLLVNPDTGEPITRKVNRVYLEHSDKVDTSLITDISNGKDGVKLKLVDKMQCWNKLQEFFGWTDESNVKETLNNQILLAIAGKINDNWNKDEDVYDELHEALRKDD